MSEANDGWIPCMKDNEPPEGFQFDTRVRGIAYVDSGLTVPWADRAKRGDYWRPAACDGWILNDGTEQTGQVEVVFRSGEVMPSRDSEEWGWNLFDNGLSILWWRPAKAVAVEEPEVEPEHDGWIPCTADNEPSKDLRFDVLHNGKVLSGPEMPPISWSRRVANGECWRPAQRDGWKLNDGTKPGGMVDIVLQYSGENPKAVCGLIPDCNSAYLIWSVPYDPFTILWWRPAVSTVAEKVEEPESSLLGSLISAWDDYKGTVDRWRAANEVIRDVMGDRDRVIMRHDGELYLVEWDDVDRVSWVQIDEI